MDGQTTGRVNPTYDDLAHRKSDMGRVTPETDYQTLRTNNKALNQQLGVGQRDARTDLVNPKHKMGNPFTDCKRLAGQGLKPQQIAKRMSAKGYSAATIKRAMRQAVPSCRNMSQKQFNQHWKQHVQPAMRTPQAVRNQARLQKFKQQNGIPKNYDNMKAMKQVGKAQAREHKTAARAQASHERKTIGQNRMDGVKQQAIRQQAPKVDRSAARARIEATRQQRAQQRPQRTMRR